MFKRQRPNACQECYDSRVKCTFMEGNGGKCKRCARQGRSCTPRLIQRARVEQKKPTTVAQLGMVNARLNPKVILETFFEDPDLKRHYAAAACYVQRIKAISVPLDATCVKTMVTVLFLMAAHQQSVTRMHAATTLAMATGTDLQILSLLGQGDRGISDRDIANLDRYVSQKYLHSGACGAAFVVRHTMGNRSIFANACFKQFFFDGDWGTLTKSALPHFKFWHKFVKDKKAADRFVSKMQVAMLHGAEPQQGVRQFQWSVDEVSPLDIEDRFGNEYTAILHETGVSLNLGRLTYLIFGFRQITPKTLPADELISRFLSHIPGLAPAFGKCSWWDERARSSSGLVCSSQGTWEIWPDDNTTLLEDNDNGVQSGTKQNRSPGLGPSSCGPVHYYTPETSTSKNNNYLKDSDSTMCLFDGIEADLATLTSEDSLQAKERGKSFDFIDEDALEAQIDDDLDLHLLMSS
mmetsp:Transcript_7818/g.13800  ORF Transcript_7818/g.13800 Transcript_7818/m.13800 type:complete len:465 (-) Transcript_7818:174-1568(-)